eukprot:gene9040-11073_t
MTSSNSVPSINNNNNNNNNKSSTFYQNYNVKFNEIINSIAVNKAGTFVCLGGKKALQIYDLEQMKTVKSILQQSTSQVGVVDWNNLSQNIIASSSNLDTFIWDIENSKYPLLGQFNSHTRAISDLSWSLFDNNVLATTSADSFVNIWDLRSPKKAIKFKSLSSHILGAIQVKWNKFNSNVLASAHESNLMIWDLRKENQELNTTVHSARVYGIDWSPHDPSEIITCSQDKTVKIWTYPNPKPKAIISTSNPVLRAKYLPVGKGIVTISDRGENHIRLWSLSDQSVPISTFTGHSDSVRSFDFRVKNTPDSLYQDIQLISWSKDQYLRLWKLDNPLKDSLGIRYDPSTGIDLNNSGSNGGNFMNDNNNNSNLNISNNGGLLDYNNNNGDQSFDQQQQDLEYIGPKDLEYELKIVQNKFIDQSLKIENINLAKRMCLVTCSVSNSYQQQNDIKISSDGSNNNNSNNNNENNNSFENNNNNGNQSSSGGYTTVQIRMSFPSLYPNGAVPSFEFLPHACTTSIKTNISILSALNDISWNRVSRNLPCFEQCLVKLVSIVKQIVIDRSLAGTNSPKLDSLDEQQYNIELKKNTNNNNNNNNNIIELDDDLKFDEDEQPQQKSYQPPHHSLIPNINLRNSNNSIEIFSNKSVNNNSNSNLNNNNNNNNNNNSSKISKSPVSPRMSDNNSFRPINKTTSNEILFLNNYKDANEEQLPLSPILSNIVNNNYTNPSWSAIPSFNSTSSSTGVIATGVNELSLSTHRNSMTFVKHVENYPCPRLCGAVFGGNGKLIVFRNNVILKSTTSFINPPRTYKELLTMMTPTLKNSSTNQQTSSPSLLTNTTITTTATNEDKETSAIKHSNSSNFLIGTPPTNSLVVNNPGGYLSPLSSSPVNLPSSLSSNSNLLNNNNNNNSKRLSNLNNTNNSNIIIQNVKIYDISSLSLINYTLATNYTLSGESIEEICTTNGLVAASVNRKDLVKLWSTLRMITDSKLYFSYIPSDSLSSSKKGLKMDHSQEEGWPNHPLGRKLVHSLFVYYQKLGDVQTLAMISCFLSLSAQYLQKLKDQYENENSGNLHTITISPSTSSPNHFLYSQTQPQPHQSLSQQPSHSSPLHYSATSTTNSTTNTSTNMSSSTANYLPSLPAMTTQYVQPIQTTFSNISNIDEIIGRPYPSPHHALSFLHNDHSLDPNNNNNIFNNNSLNNNNYLSPQFTHLQSSPIPLSQQHQQLQLQTVPNSNTNSSIPFSSTSFQTQLQQPNYQQQFQQQIQQSLHQKPHSRGATTTSTASIATAINKSTSSPTIIDPNLCLLEPYHSKLYDSFRSIYSDLLYRWGLLEKRAEILKYIQNQEPEKPIAFSIECLKCKRKMNDYFCTNCKIYAFKCSICNISVKGLSSFCLSCGHGGHTEHIKKWFSTQTKCPTGCGCVCVLNKNQQLQQQQQQQQQLTNSQRRNSLIPDTSEDQFFGDHAMQEICFSPTSIQNNLLLSSTSSTTSSLHHSHHLHQHPHYHHQLDG